MKICMFVRNPFTHDTRVIKEARSLISAGHKVEVIALLAPGLPASEIREDGIIVKRVRKIYFDEESVLGRGILTWFRFKSDWVFRFVRSLPASLALYLYKFKILFFILSPAAILFSILVFVFRTLIIFPIKSAVNIVKNIIISLKKIIGITGGNIFFSPIYEDFINAGLQSSADIYHAHDLNVLMPAVITAKKKDAKVVYDSHELFVDRNTKESRLKRLGWILLESQLIKHVQAVITVSDSIAKALAERYHIDLPTVVRNVQKYTPFENSDNLRNLPELAGYPSQICIAIYAGRITRGRGLEKLIDASQYLKNVVIVMIGGGNNTYRERIMRSIHKLDVEDKVLVLSPVSPDLINEYLCSADIGLLTTENLCLSYYYGAPNKLFHYLMAGLPVIISNQPEKRKIVEKYDVGQVIEKDTPEDIAGLIQRLADDSVYRKELSKNCLAAAKILNWDNEEKKLLHLYQRIIDPQAVLSDNRN